MQLPVGDVRKADWEHEKKRTGLETMKAWECKREGKQYVGLAVKDHQRISEGGYLKLLSWGMSLFRPGLLTFPEITCNTWHCYSTQGFLLSLVSIKLTQLMMLEI